jgi:hypothetical protein
MASLLPNHSWDNLRGLGFCFSLHRDFDEPTIQNFRQQLQKQHLQSTFRIGSIKNRSLAIQ